MFTCGSSTTKLAGNAIRVIVNRSVMVEDDTCCFLLSNTGFP